MAKQHRRRPVRARKVRRSRRPVGGMPWWALPLASLVIIAFLLSRL